MEEFLAPYETMLAQCKDMYGVSTLEQSCLRKKRKNKMSERRKRKMAQADVVIPSDESGCVVVNQEDENGKIDEGDVVVYQEDENGKNDEEGDVVVYQEDEDSDSEWTDVDNE